MIFFTSDLHLGHENAIEFTNRPFANVDEMNTVLLRNINDVVGLKDELWILGDFAFKIRREGVAALRKQIIFGTAALQFSDLRQPPRRAFVVFAKTVTVQPVKTQKPEQATEIKKKSYQTQKDSCV